MLEKEQTNVTSPEPGAPENASRPAEERDNDLDQATVAQAAAKENEELQQRLLRLQADFDNFRRRARLEKEELSQVVAAGVIKELFPVLDNFERAVAASAQDVAQLRTGVEMVHRQFVAILEKLGVKYIAAVGDTFDPARHEAVARVEDAGQPDGLIVDELQKGYEMGGRVLRPSMVRVVSNA